jgi:hypothetical protein
LPPALDPSDNASLNAFSSMRLNRLPVKQLSDDRLVYALNRAMLIRHSRFFNEVASEALERPGCREKIDLGRVYKVLADLAVEQNRPEDALEWIQKGKEIARAAKDSFNAVFQCELRELMLRLRDPDDPQLPAMIVRMRDYYAPKVPNFEAYLYAILDSFGVSAPRPGTEAMGLPGAAGASTPGGLWTPESATVPSGGEKKLWLPGQS